MARVRIRVKLKVKGEGKGKGTGTGKGRGEGHTKPCLSFKDSAFVLRIILYISIILIGYFNTF